MLVVFSPIFVVDTKIIFRYNFIAPLMEQFKAATLRKLTDELHS